MDEIIYKKCKVKVEMFRELTLQQFQKIINLQTSKLFINITYSEDEITLIYETTEGDNVLYSLIDTNSEMNEVGFIYKIIKDIKDLDIPILYITSCNNNYVIIPDVYQSLFDEKFL